MARVDELEKARKKRARKRLMRRLMALLMTLILAFGILYALQGGLLRVAAGRVADGMMVFLAGETLPVTLSIGRPVWAADLSGRIALSDGALLNLYTRAGRQLSSHVLGYQNPAFWASGQRVLTCDMGGPRFDLYFWGDRLFSKDLGGAIYCADLGPNGHVAIGGRSDTAQSGVWVYGETGQLYFRWNSSELVVSAVALGGGGNKLAFAGISTEGGEVYSAINLYNIDKEDPTARTTLPGEAVAALGYTPQGVVVISDHRVTLLDEKGDTKAVYDYTDSPVAYALSDRGEVALVTGDYIDRHSLKLTLLDSHLALVGSWEIQSEVSQVGFAGHRPFVVADERLMCFEPGQEVEITRLPEGILALPGSGEVYYITPTHLRKVALPAA